MNYKIGILYKTEQAEKVASFLSAPITTNIDFNNFDLILDLEKDTTVHLNPKLDIGKKITVNFSDYKKKIRLIKNSNLKKAIFGKALNNPLVIDATGGLGVDSVKLTMLGAKVVAFEENKILYSLLKNALENSSIKDKLAIYNVSSENVFKNKDNLKPLLSSHPDVIYLDPMFPSREKSSKVKKESQFLQKIVNQSSSAKELLESAFKTNVKRIVVKRPKDADPINAQSKPNFNVSGKSTRYDVYLR